MYLALRQMPGLQEPDVWAGEGGLGRAPMAPVLVLLLLQRLQPGRPVGLHEGDWETVQFRMDGDHQRPDLAVYAQHVRRAATLGRRSRGLRALTPRLSTSPAALTPPTSRLAITRPRRGTTWQTASGGRRSSSWTSSATSHRAGSCGQAGGERPAFAFRNRPAEPTRSGCEGAVGRPGGVDPRGADARALDGAASAGRPDRAPRGPSRHLIRLLNSGRTEAGAAGHDSQFPRRPDAPAHVHFCGRARSAWQDRDSDRAARVPAVRRLREYHRQPGTTVRVEDGADRRGGEKRPPFYARVLPPIGRTLGRLLDRLGLGRKTKSE